MLILSLCLVVSSYASGLSSLVQSTSINTLQDNRSLCRSFQSQTFLGQKTGEHFPKDSNFYPVYKGKEIQSNSTYYRADLTLVEANESCMGDPIKNLTFEVFFLSPSVARVMIKDANNQRWEPPNNYPYYLSEPSGEITLNVTMDPFSFELIRTQDGEPLWSTLNSPMPQFYYADKYIEITSSLPPNPNVYGLGERVTSFRLNTNETYYTIWALAQDCPYDTGKGPRGRNMYGQHPVYLEIRNGSTHGVYFHNFNAMDVVFSQQKIAFKTVGGIVDLFVFKGPEAEKVLEDYHQIIGLPMLPPYWAMGYHQCRWGYKNLGMLWDVVTGYENHEIPLDVLWSDIDYMLSFYDFTLDYSRYSKEGMKALTSHLKDNNMFYVPIVDAGVSASDYFGKTQGNSMNVFVKRNYGSSENFIGQVWPGKALFVDFFHPNASDYWNSMLDVLYESLEFDGIWLDMNEASSFCDGTCPGFYNTSENKITLPYLPGHHSLEDQLFPLTAAHHPGPSYINHNPGPSYIDYNTHGLFGTMETKFTHNYLLDKFKTRPFVLSRSTNPGHGKYGFHWLGDNFATWDQLRYSIQGILSFQIYGIPMVGADTCGFHNSTTPELCSRWLELATFYTFMRNHNDIGAKPQELFALGDTVIEVGQKMIRLRYSLFVYMYSQVFKVAMKGGSVLKPMFFEFPNAKELYANQEQFMVGPALLVAPVLYENQRTVKVELPQGAVWYDYFTGERMESGTQVLDAPIDKVNVLIRGGYIVPVQDSEGAMTLKEMMSRSVKLVVALDEDQKAYGEYYLDDGLSPDTLESQKYTKVMVTAQASSEGVSFNVTSEVNNYTGNRTQITEAVVYGLKIPVKEVTNGKVLSYSSNMLIAKLSINLTVL